MIAHPEFDLNTLAMSADPYSIYGRMREFAPLFFDEQSGGWIVTGWNAAVAILRHPAARVRPPDAIVPTHLQGSALGNVMGQLVRFREDDARVAIRDLLGGQMHAFDPGFIRQSAETEALRQFDPDGADTIAVPGIDLVDRILARVLELGDLPTGAIEAIARAIAPGLGPVDLVAADHAVLQVREVVARAIGTETAPGRILMTGEAAGVDRSDLIANVLGLLFQNHDATAGLIGNSLVCLTRNSDLLETVRTSPDHLAPFLAEVLRFDGPVQHTRRFASEAMRIEEQDLPAGAEIVVLLAAANRDPIANDRADEFLLLRSERQGIGFGMGRHLCPGDSVALEIAAGVVRAMLPVRNWSRLRFDEMHYRPLRNTRVPIIPVGPAQNPEGDEK